MALIWCDTGSLAPPSRRPLRLALPPQPRPRVASASLPCRAACPFTSHGASTHTLKHMPPPSPPPQIPQRDRKFRPIVEEYAKDEETFFKVGRTAEVEGGGVG